MKKLFIAFAAIAMVFTSCSEDKNDTLQEQNINMDDWYVYTNADLDEANKVGNEKSKSCYTMVNLNRLLNEDSGLEKRMYDIEYNTRAFIAARKPDGVGGGNGGGPGDGGGGGTGTDGIIPWADLANTNTIPVIFHVIYSASSENIPDSQIDEQITALNEDFRANNPNRGNIPDDFTSLEADLGVNFELAGVVRKQNKKKKSWRPDDSMKFSSSGGSDVIDPEHYLNIWVVNNMPYQGGTILGYAQFPGGSWSTDGIVLGSRFVGNTSYSTGRTATHEIGHWMNLRHIWGDGPCGYDDFVADTPEADSYNSGCPSYPGPTSCSTAEMFMNFMDYTSDTCMNLFTDGQSARMAAQFTNAGFRKNMGISIN